MRGINERQMLRRMLDECEKCHTYYHENVPMIVSESGALTNAQVEALIIEMHKHHQERHVH